MNTDEALYASLAFNGLTTIIIIVLCWRCFRRRHCCSSNTSRQFNKLEESLSEERRRTNGEHVSDYASVEQAGTRKYITSKSISDDDVICDSTKTHSRISTDTLSDPSYDKEVSLSKEESTDRNVTQTATIIDIDETNNGTSNEISEQTGELREEKQYSGDVGKTDEFDLPTDQPNIMLGQAENVPGQPGIELVLPDNELDQPNTPLDQQTVGSLEEDFEETFDKRHSKTDEEEVVQEEVEEVVKPSMTVQIFSKDDITMIRNATDELMSNLEVPDLLVTHARLQNMASVNPELPLLIICVHTSRLGTDATNAVKGLLHPKSTGLLILHHQEKHALPVNRSDRILTDPQFDNIGGIFDFAYRADSGLYSCEMNTSCLDQLEKFINRCQSSTD